MREVSAPTVLAGYFPPSWPKILELQYQFGVDQSWRSLLNDKMFKKQDKAPYRENQELGLTNKANNLPTLLNKESLKYKEAQLTN